MAPSTASSRSWRPCTSEQTPILTRASLLLASPWGRLSQPSSATDGHVPVLGHGEARDAGSAPVDEGGLRQMTEATIRGTVEAGFESVADSFARGFEKGELGAAVSAYVDGNKVVDLWGGWADAARTREWQHDTITPTYSAAKGMTATCAHVLVDRGVLDVDEPVAAYWPEFAQAGKDKITVRMVLSHQAGLRRATALDGGSSVVVSGMVIAPEKRFDW